MPLTLGKDSDFLSKKAKPPLETTETSWKAKSNTERRPPRRGADGRRSQDCVGVTSWSVREKPCGTPS